MNKLDDLITDEFNMKIDDDIDVDEHVILPTITEHQDEEMLQSQHDMTDNLNDSLSDTKSLIVKNPNPFTNLTNMDDSFLEEERKAIEETSILDEFQDELSENHRPTHSLRDYSFEEFQQDIVENVILKKERILDIETNEDEVTKHFYSNEKTTSKPAEETDFLDMDVVENHQITQQDDNNQGVISESDENQTDNRNLLKKNNSMTSVVDSLDETVNNENEQSTPQIENLEAPIVSTDSKNEKDKLYNDVSISSLKQQSNEITPTILTTQTPKTRSQSDKKTSLSTKSKTSKPKLAILENTTINVKQKQQQPIVKSRLNFDEVERILSMHKRDVSPNKVQNRLFIPTSDIFHKDDLLTRRPSNFETEYFRMFVKPLEKKRVPIPSTSITRTFIKKPLIKSYSGLLPNMGGKNTSIGGSAMIQGSVEKRSRSLSEKRLAAKMAKEVEPLPNQPYLWHTFSTKYAPNKQQKKHVSWSPVREYIHDGRTNDDDRRTTRHTNDISQNKPIK
ncbi:unnamed protein product [Didymodactylos carnosus]|uniref:Uncharacterized protein n=1 Tax=Didymodactylos carnosus TaxID=1234261 RepID=A0A8S2DV89_9BILA|nr:unnamed protein product [Didymodactylos carnosus]CAF3826977.1 unnamed protein product [Didymodactylos carnosus]